MGLGTTALEIGRSALMSYQSALQVLGNNVSNAGNPDYTRQAAGLSSVNGVALPEGFRPGAGVALTSLKRSLDEALEHRLRVAIGGQHSVQAEEDALARVEVLFDELTGMGMAAKMGAFFGALDEVHNNPSDTAIRSELLAIGEDADAQIATLVDQVNDIGAEIAELNTQIVAAEAGGHGPANALRDRRDALLRDLSEIVDVNTSVQEDGSLYVFIGSEALVQGGVARELAAEQELDGELVRTVVTFADSGADINPRGGAIRGLIDARDLHAYGGTGRLDELAAGIIAEVNRIHSDGQGLVGFTSVTGTVSVLDPTAALDDSDTNLMPRPQNGSFFIVVSDDTTHTPVAYQIEIDLDGEGADTTLETLVTEINDTVTGVTASITADNRLRLDADAGVSFSFGHDGQDFREDTSDVLAALGVNTFFSGTDASDIAVNAVLQERPDLLAAATVNLPGDGGNAARLASLDTASSTQLGNVGILDFYNNVAADVAVTAGAVHNGVQASGAIVSALQAEKESISGVSLDEEAIDLLKYERAFQGAARYVNVVDRLLDEMMALVR